MYLTKAFVIRVDKAMNANLILMVSNSTKWCNKVLITQQSFINLKNQFANLMLVNYGQYFD